VAGAFAAGSGRVLSRWRGAAFVRHRLWQVPLPQAAAGCLFAGTERVSFAMAMADAFAA